MNPPFKTKRSPNSGSNSTNRTRTGQNSNSVLNSTNIARTGQSPNSVSNSTYKRRRGQSSIVNPEYFQNSMKIIEKFHDSLLVNNVKKICYDGRFKDFIDEFLFDTKISKGPLFIDSTPDFYNLLFNKNDVKIIKYRHVTDKIYKRYYTELNLRKSSNLRYDPEVFIYSNFQGNKKKNHIYIKSIKILVDVIKDCQEDKCCSLIPTDYNLLFKLHLFIIIRSYECFINNDIRNLIKLSYIMTQFDEQSFSVEYTIEGEYLKFIQYFMKSSGLHNKFDDYVPDNLLMSNTVVKDIINVFVKEIIIKSMSLDGGYKIFNFTKDENTLVIRFPDGWEEKKDDVPQEEKNNNYNMIKITDNKYSDIGMADYLKLQNNFVNEMINLIFKDINDIFFKQEGGRKKKIQVKNTKHSKIITGPRGGKYMLLPNGKKQYLSK